MEAALYFLIKIACAIFIVAFVVIHFRSENVRGMGQALSSDAYCPYLVMEIS